MNELAKRETVERMPSAALTPMDMIDRALSSGAGVDVMEKLMALQERWEANQGRKAFDHAIAQAKAEIPPIIRNRLVDFTSQKGRTSYRHEDLAEIARTVDPILSKFGLSYRYRTTQADQKVSVTCVLSHRDGYSEETTLESAPDGSGNKNHIQAVGSAVTFLQRYTLKAALGLAVTDDDDGRAAASSVTINADQFQQLRAKLDATGADEARFLAYLKVEHLEELPAARFPAAMAALAKKEKAGA